MTHFFCRSVPDVHLQRDNHQPGLPSVHRCHPGSFNNTVPSRLMSQLGRCPSQPFHTSPWMFMLLCPKWQICSAAYGIIELHFFVLSLFPCSSSATAVLCLLFDSLISWPTILSMCVALINRLKEKEPSTYGDAPWLLLPHPTTRCKGGRRRRAERRKQPPLPHPAPPHRVTVFFGALHLDVEHCPRMRDRTDKALLPPSSPWIQLLFPADSRRHEVTSGAAGGVKAIKCGKFLTLVTSGTTTKQKGSLEWEQIEQGSGRPFHGEFIGIFHGGCELCLRIYVVGLPTVVRYYSVTSDIPPK
uniref:Uncharacterized protein n=1 Tax=Aegilops tauschii TaxID=37682 RepID=M8CDP7_AEGTA